MLAFYKEIFMRKLVVLAAILTALSLRAEQKNVQLLTGLSDLQLQRTMNMMRASLGVHCDFCHVITEKEGWQFDKDDKKEKKTAREMIAMVIKINQEQFKGRAAVSCWTCHRGTTEPKSLVTLPQTPPPFPTPQPEKPILPALADVVKKYGDALGDVAKLQQPRTMKGTRESFDGKPVPIEVQESGERWHITADMPAGRIEQIVNESGGWSRDAKGPAPFPPTGTENFREIALLMTPVLPSAIPADGRVVAKEMVGNHETVVVAFRSGERTRERLSFDTTSGLLVRRLIIADRPIGPVPRQVEFDDWRVLDGAMFPFLIKTSLVDPWAGSMRRYTEVKLGAKIEESVFAAPK